MKTKNRFTKKTGRRIEKRNDKYEIIETKQIEQNKQRTKKCRNVLEVVLTLNIVFVAVAMQIKEFLFFYLQSNK